MSEFADLISSITFLLLVIIIGVLLFRQPEWLKSLLGNLGLLRRLKLGGFEAELSSKNQSEEPIGTALFSPHSEKATESSEVDHEYEVEEPTQGFLEVMEMLEEGKYQQGMDLLRDVIVRQGWEKEKSKWLAVGQYLAFTHGTPEALNDLQRTAEQNKQVADVRISLARAYAHVGQLENAQKELMQAREDVVDELGRVEVVIETAKFYRGQENYDAALSLLKEMTSTVENYQARARLYVGLAETYKEKNPPDYQKSLAMYEFALRCNPLDTSLRFDVAYLYGEQEAPAMALSHYQSLLATKRNHSTALNNSGVEAGKLSLPITSVNFYKQSEDEGSSLAMSNLASNLLSVGFLSEAKSKLNQARELDDVHERISLITGQVASAAQTETNRLEELTKSSESVRKWRIRFAKAMVVLVKDYSSLTGRYEENSSWLDLKVDKYGNTAGEFKHTSMRNTANFSGKFEGSSLEFKWETVRPDDTNVLLWSSTKGSGQIIVENQSVTGYSVSEPSMLDSSKFQQWKELELVLVDRKSV